MHVPILMHALQWKGLGYTLGSGDMYIYTSKYSNVLKKEYLKTDKNMLFELHTYIYAVVINKKAIRILTISDFNTLQIFSINHETVSQILFTKSQENSHTYTLHIAIIFSFNTKLAENSMKYHWSMN
jgi:hypothetical protein